MTRVPSLNRTLTVMCEPSLPVVERRDETTDGIAELLIRLLAGPELVDAVSPVQ
jgi:hypothetical protein